jgi:hypothetical protein
MEGLSVAPGEDVKPKMRILHVELDTVRSVVAWMTLSGAIQRIA